MKEVTLKDSALRQAAAAGTEAFVGTVVDAIRKCAGGELNADALAQLTADQVTLWGFSILHEELMSGGFVQLIHNGYGPFFFDNPFAKALKLWGLRELSKMLYDARRLYLAHAEAITRDCTEEEFMALYEQYPDFDELDDLYVEQSDSYMALVAHYVDDHLTAFATIIENE